MSDHVRGFCPMGCGETLVASQGYGDLYDILCTNPDCTYLDAVTRILANPYLDAHVVELTSMGFTIKHPISERVDDALFSCQLHTYISRLDRPPRDVGYYYVRGSGHNWTWETAL